jgi:hypothetical protein
MAKQAHKQFRIICTDQGQHPSRELVVLVPEAPFGIGGAWVGDADELGTRWKDWVPLADRNSTGHLVSAKPDWAAVGDGEHAWRFRCPSCKRDVPINDQRLSEIVMGFIDRGVPQLDISRIPS